MARFARELGVPSPIIGQMASTPPSQIVWLDARDLRSMGVKPHRNADRDRDFAATKPSVPQVPDTWRSRVPYALKAAALAAGTLLATPYLAIYDMVVLAIPAAFLVRIGLKTGFRGYELPALGGALVLIACYFTATPTGLGATRIVSILILGRAGSWWRREPAPAVVAAGV
jgi:hypothetical protein